MGALLLPSLLTPWAPIAGSSAAPASRGSEAPEVLCCSRDLHRQALVLPFPFWFLVGFCCCCFFPFVIW